MERIKTNSREAQPEPPPETKKAALKLMWFSHACTIAFVVVLVVAAVGRWNVAASTTYPIGQAIEWNWRARATNNLEDMANNLNRSLGILQPFHGNPSWWFPKPDTDLDQIKLNIEESRDTALEVSAEEPIGSFGYQQAVQNLQETIVEINEHLNHAKGWFVHTQAAMVLVALYLLLPLLSLAFAGSAHKGYKKVGMAGAGMLVFVWVIGSFIVGILFMVLP